MSNLKPWISVTRVITFFLICSLVAGCSCLPSANTAKLQSMSWQELKSALDLKYTEAVALFDNVEVVQEAYRHFDDEIQACQTDVCRKPLGIELYNRFLAYTSRSYILPHPADENGSFCSDVAMTLSGGALLEIDGSWNRNGNQRELSIDVNGDREIEKISLDSDAIHIESTLPEAGKTEFWKGADRLFFDGPETLVRYNHSIYLQKTGDQLIGLYYFDENLGKKLACAIRQDDWQPVSTNPTDLLLERSSLEHSDPRVFVINHLDAEALRLLVQKGYRLDGKTTSPGWQRSFMTLATERAVKAMDRGLDWITAKRFLGAVLALGASPGVETDDNSDRPIDIALRAHHGQLVRFLVMQGAFISSPYHNISGHIIRSFRDRKEREDLLLLVNRERGVIDAATLEYAINNQDDFQFLQQLVGLKLPLERIAATWVNGRETGFLTPLTRTWIMARENGTKALELLRGVEYEVGDPSGKVIMTAMYEYDGRLVAASYPSTSGPVSRSDAEVAKLLNFSTNLCLHLVGGDCGPPELLAQARKWFANLTEDCPDRYATIFDEPVCKLAMYWLHSKDYFLYLNDLNDEYSRNGLLLGLRPFSKLGTKSLHTDNRKN